MKSINKNRPPGLSPALGVRVHFVGIGGIGMCGLAELLHNSGSVVTGSDLVENPQIGRLKEIGIPVFIGHKKANIGRAEIVVQSSAVPENNVEIQTAKAQKILVMKRSEALAEVMRLKRGLVVAGTHGKTTTTHLLSLMFIHSQKDPTVVIGGRSHLFQSTAFLGKGEWFIAESDESDGGFKHLSPEIALITNIDHDHVDYYGSFKNLKQAFLNFALKTPFYGAIVACGDDPVLRDMLSTIDRKVIFYGFKPGNHFILKKISPLNPTGFVQGSALWDSPSYRVHKKHENSNKIGIKYKVFMNNSKKPIGTLNMPLYGSMNGLNALGAVASAMTAGLSFKECAKSLQKFKGIDRRFQKKGVVKGIEFYDDYAHHPTEIKALLSAFREKWGRRKRLVVLFQPHRFSRTKACWPDFLTCFKEADCVLLMDIYPAGEKPLKGISSKNLAKEIKHPFVLYCPHPQGGVQGSAFEVLRPRYQNMEHSSSNKTSVQKLLKKGDVLITMGAGSVSKYGPALMALLSQTVASRPAPLLHTHVPK